MSLIVPPPHHGVRRVRSRDAFSSLSGSTQNHLMRDSPRGGGSSNQSPTHNGSGTSGYSKLLEYAGQDRVTETNRVPRRGAGKIFTSGKLVSSHPLKNGRHRIALEKTWWEQASVLHTVFEYLGLHQLFLGRVQDDNQRLFHFDRLPNVACTATVCKMWGQFARTMTVADFRPLRYTITDVGLRQSLSTMRSVRELNLPECRGVKFVLDCFDYVGRELQVLNLVGCTSLSDASLYGLTKAMPNLRELYLPACTNLEKVSIATHFVTLPDGKSRSGSSIEVLDISANSTISDEVIERLVTEHCCLKEMFLSQLDKLTRPRIRSENLELLNMDGCENLSFATALDIMQGCPALKYITLGDNDKMLDEPCKRFVPLLNIVELNISATFQDDDTVNTALENLPMLRLFDCGNSEFVRRPRLKHPKLEVLVLNMCCELQDSCFVDIETKLPNLRHLSCNHCDSLVRPSITHRQLRLADFSNCTYLCSDSTAFPWLMCTNLRNLFLGHTQYVTDRELEAVIDETPHLAELNLYQASGLARPQVDGLAELVTINLMNCWNIQLEWLHKLQELRPKLIVYVNAEDDYYSDDSGSCMEGGDPAGW